MSTSREAAASFEELDKSREIQPGRRSHQHVNVRLQNCELNDLNVVTCCRLLEEVFEKRLCSDVDHREAIKRRPCKMDKQLMR